MDTLRQPRIVLFLMAGWSLLATLSEVFTSTELFMDREGELGGLLGGFAVSWEGIALAAVYLYCARDPYRFRAVYWLALLQTGAMVVSQIYHVAISNAVPVESVVIPLGGSLFLMFLVFANLFQRKEDETDNQRRT
jgi:hypothetical protein